jgi:glucose/arabinose dehydrogenase
MAVIGGRMMARALQALWLLFMIAGAVVPSGASATLPAGFSESTLVTGLTQPTAIAFLPDDGMLVAEKGGSLLQVRDGSVAVLANLAVCTDKSMGLLGVAVDPNFSSNGFVYTYRTKPAGNEGPSCPTESGRVNEVVRLRLEGDLAVGGPTAIFTGIRTDNGQHNGGALRVGPDSRLYVSTGDTGLGDFRPGGGTTPPGQSTNPFAQDLGELPGKVLRIGLDGGVPPDNPFVGVPGARPEVFAYGFRNPFRFGFDPATGSLWLGDVGENTWEELDIVHAGGNYGWPQCEGTEPPGCDPPGHVAPVFEYQHDVPGSLGASITGGAFAPCGFGPLAGQYFFADYASDRVYHAVPNLARDGVAEPPATFSDAAEGPVDIVFGPDGALYYVAIKAGRISRVRSTTTACANLPAPLQNVKVPSLPAGGVGVDRTPPRLRIRYRSKQRLGALELSVRLDERATVSVSAKVLRGRTKLYGYRPLKRRLEAGKTMRLRLRTRSRALSRLRHAGAHHRLVARIVVTAVDGTGNAAHRTALVHLIR